MKSLGFGGKQTILTTLKYTLFLKEQNVQDYEPEKNRKVRTPNDEFKNNALFKKRKNNAFQKVKNS